MRMLFFRNKIGQNFVFFKGKGYPKEASIPMPVYSYIPFICRGKSLL